MYMMTVIQQRGMCTKLDMYDFNTLTAQTLKRLIFMILNCN